MKPRQRSDLQTEKDIDMPGTWIFKQDKPGFSQGIKVKVNF